MNVNNYATLCIDVHGVVIDRDSAIWARLGPLLSRLKVTPEKSRVLDDYLTTMNEVADEQMGTVVAHCLVYLALADKWGLHVGWQEGIDYASGLGMGVLYEDAPGAIQYLRKFYTIKAVTSLNENEFASFNERLRLDNTEYSAAASFMRAHSEICQWAMREDVLLLSGAPAPKHMSSGYCRIVRDSGYVGDGSVPCFATLSDFVRQHQIDL